MSTKVVIILALLCRFKGVTASINCLSIESVADHALFHHTYKLTSGTRMESCAARCDADPLCYSFNYVIPTMTCELNNASRSTDSGDFLRRPDAVYFDKLKAPHDFCQASPCKNNGTCKILSRGPGFECSCSDEYTGETCEGKK